VKITHILVHNLFLFSNRLHVQRGKFPPSLKLAGSELDKPADRTKRQFHSITWPVRTAV